MERATPRLGLTEAHGLNQNARGRDLAGESMFEYGSRVGFWRLMRLFQERKLPMTVFACALALERHKPAAEAIRASGFDVCSPRLALDQARRPDRGRGARAYQAGRRLARGHRRRAAARLVLPLWSERQHAPLVVEEGGFLYDSDYYADELPFWRTVAGARI